jgi:hypothetical protein
VVAFQQVWSWPSQMARLHSLIYTVCDAVMGWGWEGASIVSFP